MFHIVRRWFSLEVLFRPLRPRKRRRPSHRSRREAFLRTLEKPAFESLESRQMLDGYAWLNAQNDPTSGAGYSVLNTTPFTLDAPGVLANDSDSGGYQMSAHLASDPAHGTVTLNGDGSFTYTATLGYTGQDSFTYYDTEPTATPATRPRYRSLSTPARSPTSTKPNCRPTR